MISTMPVTLLCIRIVLLGYVSKLILLIFDS